MSISLSQMAQGANVKTAPEMFEAFPLATKLNPSLKLEELNPEDRAALSHWFKRYYGIQITQVSNLRRTINQPHKHLALDLVALVKPEVKDHAGLSYWFPEKQ